MRINRFVAVAILLNLTATIPADAVSAQPAPRVWAVASGTSVSAQSELSNGIATISGTIVGADGGLSWGRLSVRAGYAQGNVGVTAASTGGPGTQRIGLLGSIMDALLAPSSPAQVDVNHVEGFLNAGVLAFPSLEIGAGARARAIVSGDATERVLMWTVGARFEAPIGLESVRGFAEVWNALGGTDVSTQQFDSGRGGSAGILARIGPIASRLSYGIDATSHGNGQRRETVEGFTLALGVVTR